jgi:hypothetical protein
MSDDEDLFDRELEGHELDILISLTRGEEDGEDEDVPGALVVVLSRSIPNLLTIL